MEKHFNPAVPADLQAKIRAFVDAAMFETIVTGHKAHETYSDEKVDPIYGVSVPGFIPFQDGGFTRSQIYRFDIDASYHFTDKQTDRANEMQTECFDAFKSDNGIDRETEWDALTEEQRESAFEYENEWFSDGALLSLQIFAEGFCNGGVRGRDEKQVTIRLSINYNDAPYFREKHAEDIRQEVLSVDEFMAADLGALVQKFTV